MSKPILLAAAIAALACGSNAAHAVSGAVELAPFATPDITSGEADRSTLSGYYLAGRQALSQRDFRSAAGFYASALQRDPQNKDLLDRSVQLDVASGNISRASDYARRLLEERPQDELALVTVAVRDLRAGDTEASAEAFTKLKAVDSPLAQAAGNIFDAWRLAGEGKPAAAVRQLDDVKGGAWIELFAKFHAGLIADGAGLSKVSVDRLSLAHERDSGDPRVVEAYARALAREGRKDRALAVVERFTSQMNATDKVTDALRAEIESGDVKPMISSTREGIAEGLSGLGRVLAANDAVYAASFLQLALHLTPEADYPALALGRVLESLRQYAAAIDVYRAVPQEAPLRRDAQMQEAINLNILERHDEAEALLTALLAEKPTDTQVAISLGNVHRSQENFGDAADVYAAAIDNFGNVPEPLWTLHYYLGIALERTDRWSGAEKEFRRALELSPDHPLVLNYLGYSYIDRGENLDEALDMVRRAVQQRPDDGYIVDSLGWAYYRLGRYEDAVRELERAVSLRPADPVINDHLGDAYWKVGRELEARFQWAHARDNKPEPKELEKILKKLEGGLSAVEENAKTADAAAADDSGDGEQPTAQ
ncbi:MAG: tetratricopeptide repeat protein [Pseudomonadota bacterium]